MAPAKSPHERDALIWFPDMGNCRVLARNEKLPGLAGEIGDVNFGHLDRDNGAEMRGMRASPDPDGAAYEEWMEGAPKNALVAITRLHH